MGKPQSNFQHRTIFGVPLIAGNLEIEPMLIHPTKWGYRNNKNKNNYLLFLLQNEKHEHNFRDPGRHLPLC